MMIGITSTFHKPLEIALDGAISYLQSLEVAPVCASTDTQTLRARMQKPLGAEGVPAERVIEDLVADTQGGLVRSSGGRFFAWVIGGSLPSALAADWLTSAWDQNAAQFGSSPAAAMAEEVAGLWLKELLNVPAEASVGFVTGCQMAHATCIAAARHALLEARGHDVERSGLYGAPPVRIITSEAYHGSITRAVRLLGMGSGNIVSLPSASDGRLDVNLLNDALNDAHEDPAIVVLQAGDINTGVFDDFQTLIPVAKAHDAWVHIDGAFGLWAAASPQYRDLVKGVEAADSWATDGHKLLNVPYDCGYAFVRAANAHRASMFTPTPYIPIADDGRSPMQWNPEWSRRARGFATYAALRELGREGIANLVDRCCAHARAIATGIGSLDGAQLLWEPVFNQGLVRFLDPRPDMTDEDHDRFTDAVIADITSRGEAFFGGTAWNGRRAMRVSVCNWQTNEADVDRTIRSVAETLKRSRAVASIA